MTISSAERPSAPFEAPAWRRHLTLFLICVVAALSYIDRQVFTLFMDEIKAELDLTDTQLGLLSGVTFALFYAVAAFPIARYADRGDRGLVIGACLAVWSLATAACGLAHSFWQMLLARAGLAAGEAGSGPASNSLMVDIYPPERRVMVLSTFLAANAVGLASGLAIGGWLSQWFSWREVFFILGFAGLPIALLVWRVALEPRRRSGPMESAASQITLRETLRTMFGSPSLRWIALLLCSVPVTGLGVLMWSPSFFQRVHGLTISETGYWLGAATMIGLVGGNLAAGWLGDRYGKDNPRFNGMLASGGLLLAFPFALLFALADDVNVSLASFMVLKFVITLHLGPIIALAFAQVPASMRAMTSAAINMFISLAGTGLGVFLAGALSEHFTAQYGHLSLRYSLATLSGGLLIGGVAAWMAARTARPLPAA
jgi:MFS family permease